MATHSGCFDFRSWLIADLFEPYAERLLIPRIQSSSIGMSAITVIASARTPKADAFRGFPKSRLLTQSIHCRHKMLIKKSDNPESSNVLGELWASVQLAGHWHQTNEANVPSI